ncbi:hypothetical protein CEW46_29145, partial [Bacillus cereus]
YDIALLNQVVKEFVEDHVLNQHPHRWKLLKQKVKEAIPYHNMFIRKAMYEEVKDAIVRILILKEDAYFPERVLLKDIGPSFNHNDVNTMNAAYLVRNYLEDKYEVYVTLHGSVYQNYITAELKVTHKSREHELISLLNLGV